MEVKLVFDDLSEVLQYKTSRHVSVKYTRTESCNVEPFLPYLPSLLLTGHQRWVKFNQRLTANWQWCDALFS